jgi:E3 ubiquitin-protein ligase HECTD2
VPEIDIWDNMQNHHLQSSSSEEDTHQRNPDHLSRPRHTRSVSHPFPSLFSGRKGKKKSSSGAAATAAAADDDDDESDSDSLAAAGSGFMGGGKPPPPTMRGHHRNGSSALGSRDFTTGHCMTCGSLVRWPQDLHMFRCTICLTVNDLQPADRVPARGGDGPEVAVTFEEQPESKGAETAHTPPCPSTMADV